MTRDLFGAPSARILIFTPLIAACAFFCPGCSCGSNEPGDRAVIREIVKNSPEGKPASEPKGPKGGEARADQALRQAVAERAFMAPAAIAFEKQRRDLRQKMRTYVFDKNYTDRPLKEVSADLAAGLSTRIFVDPKVENFKVNLACRGKKAKALFVHLFKSGIMTRVTAKSEVTFGPGTAEDEKRMKSLGAEPFSEEGGDTPGRQ